MTTRWLDDACATVARDPEAVFALCPVAARHGGRDDAVRVRLLSALPLRGDALVAALERLYRHGDAAERRAVLLALSELDVGPAAVPLVEDALRSNDTRLVLAALGGYATAHLGAAQFRQAVLKCVFLGLPLSEVDGVPARADRELAEMLRRFAEERTAAGRTVPADIRPILEEFA